MNEALRLTLAIIWGFLLGAFFFGGLWWTVRHLMRRERTALWLVGSLLLRTGIAASGFYLVAREHWQSLVPSLLGFIVARLAVTWCTRLSAHPRPASAPEASHAP